MEKKTIVIEDNESGIVAMIDSPAVDKNFWKDIQKPDGAFIPMPEDWEAYKVKAGSDDALRISGDFIENGIIVDDSTDTGYSIREYNPSVNPYDKGIEIEAPAPWVDYINNLEDSGEKTVTKREMAFSFMMQEDGIKIDLKNELRICLKKYPGKNIFIKNLYRTRLMFKDFKHLNFATKRIVLNNMLRSKLVAHSSLTRDTVNNILVLLENDSSHTVYLKNLRIVFNEITSKGININ